MPTNWIISANPEMYDHSSSFEHHSYIDWRQKANFKPDDVVFIYTTRPISSIQYKCIVTKIDLAYPNLRDDKEYWRNLDEYYKSINGKFMRLNLVEQVYRPHLSLEVLLQNGLNGSPQGPVKINSQLFEYLEANFSDNLQYEIFPELISQSSTDFEGVKRQVTVNKYERSSIARKKCVDHHGYNCSVCDINFVNIYGELGKDFIHVHHLIPIHLVGKGYKVDYKKDLIPVCPNCHAMLHRKIGGIEPTIGELRKLLNRT
ncbi:HNH endonuclease [Mucilaginibacter myungsuensis]|uniref:HNH endonuclease n=1 Tax=Mucilaginibacter myungsuensis TaxID=649104 RepID=A0A929PWS3_9SPHI|nr:HNH endonuclease [Mucilaginibacter myungsuensis]MBE9662434.1 HNH endonuclease [Mucilaginibacter myungsuensis]MDN3599129.1 HNH endonuclease [Mucilaginibacter myungsuensis]